MAHMERGADAGTDEVINQRIGEWQTRLLQLDRRNNLLYFKPGRSAVGITGVAPDDLVALLRSVRRGLRFPYQPERPVPRLGFAVAGADSEPEPEVSVGDLETDCEVGDLQRRLRNLRRRDREWEEEQGLNVLFLALGFLNWVDADGEQARSPLVLIPCDLERKSPREAFRLRREDDDPVANPTLSHRLSGTEIDLPELDGGSAEDASIDRYLDAVSSSVAGRVGWSVDRAIVLGTFSYSKLAMYEDLARMRRAGVGSELVRLLAGGGAPLDGGSGAGSATPLAEGQLAGGRLDDLLDVRDQFAVLPADFSQLQAIEEARKGKNLVIHGPPGTGKSQTIANLIATLLADGKRVLFVSEKAAALDVVKRRLEECDLGVFCLDLHSDRGRRTEVYQQLRRSLDEEFDGAASGDSSADLGGRRRLLNRATRLLHEKQAPLGLSVFEVQGHFARLRHNLRFEALAPPPAGQLTQQWLQRADDAAKRIALRPREFTEHHLSPWRALRTPQRSLQLTDLIRDDMQTVVAAIEELRERIAPHTQWLGVSTAGSAEDVRSAAGLLTLLAEAPGIPVDWLGRVALARIQRLQSEQATRQSERRTLEATLDDAFGGQGPSIDYRAVLDAVTLTPTDRRAMAQLVGSDWGRALGGDPAGLFERVDGLARALDRLTSCAATLVELLGAPSERTLDLIDEAARLGARVLDLNPVPEHWLQPGGLEEVERQYSAARFLAEEVGRDEERMGADFSDALVGLVDESMLVRYRTDHQGFSRRNLGMSYRRDRRVLQGQLRAPCKLPLVEQLRAVELALKVRHGRERWTACEQSFREALGTRFRGRDTDWEHVAGDIEELRGVINGWRGSLAVQHALLTGAERQALDAAVSSLREALSGYREAVRAVGRDELASDRLDVVATEEAARCVVEPLHHIRDATSEVLDSLERPFADFEALTEFVKCGVRLTAVREEDECFAPALASDFGAFFEGAATDWGAAARALDWTHRFLEVAQGTVTEALCRHATHPEAPMEYASRSADFEVALGRYAEVLRTLDRRFEVTATDWSAWDAAPFAEIEGWATALGEAAGEAPSWVAYRAAVNEFEERLGAGSVTALRALTDRAEDAPEIVARRAYEKWLEQVYAAEPVLREFSRVEYEEIRKRFRELDEAFPVAARRRVRERVGARYPSSTRVQTGQLGTLNRELVKRRRQMPVRKLIRSIPNLMQALKPCFLMSPLAVSQYLPARRSEGDSLEFDTVIFDEASQVLPEEAVPALERARQVIVVGDRQQLPPTTFFLGGDGDNDELDDDDDRVPDAFEGVESILDVMVGLGSTAIAHRYLLVHYRSRCESLIRFSNHTFYENRLLTFPGPEPGDVRVRDVYLPDATYDAGGSRTNRGEAERVTSMVFELMETLPYDESVGVVALSRAQADLIETLIEQGRLDRRDLDDRFGEDQPERFFVKNLENVQGDERDHMILSVGYGPTPAGAVPNRFGPINREGGERRLNVAVTRARRSMSVVHSLRPEHITSEMSGARQLRRYLEYARNPDTALEAEVIGTGEPESPFEEAVLAALRKRGHSVAAQVGVSSYRIDLAIQSQRGHRFDLGIECDGVTYHRSPAARDRDWLRQQVLEGLGWRIHRVWSTAWIKDPDGEMAAIERALDLARAGAPPERPPGPDVVPIRVPGTGETAPAPPASEEPAVDAGAATEISPRQDESRTPRDAHATGSAVFFETYRRYGGERIDGDAQLVPLERLAERIVLIVEVEHPVHIDVVVERLRGVLAVQRIREGIRSRIYGAVGNAIGGGAIRHDGEFLLLADERGEEIRPRLDPERPIGRVSDAELDAGLLAVARRTFGAGQDDLVRETARQFGWRRTGHEIRERLNERVERLVESGRLVRRGETLGEDDPPSL